MRTRGAGVSGEKGGRLRGLRRLKAESWLSPRRGPAARGRPGLTAGWSLRPLAGTTVTALGVAEASRLKGARRPFGCT